MGGRWRHVSMFVFVLLLSACVPFTDGKDMSLAKLSVQKMRAEYETLQQDISLSIVKLAKQEAESDFKYRTCLNRVCWSKWDGGPAQHQKLVFLKTHKTAGTVIAAALLRGLEAFGHKVAVPFDMIKWNFPSHVSVYDVVDVPGVDITKGTNFGYDAFVNHACYCDKSEQNIAKILSFHQELTLPPIFVSVLRDPRNRFMSAVRYYANSIQNGLAVDMEMYIGVELYDSKAPHHKLLLAWDIVKALLQKWRAIASVSGARTKELWYNGQSYELGLWDCKYHLNMVDTDSATVEAWLGKLELKFDLMMFTEHLSESMVMLAEMLNWPVELLVVPPMKLTYATNVAKNSTENVVFPGLDGLNEQQLRELDIMLNFDHQLYSRFHEPFLALIEKKQTSDEEFQSKLTKFKKLSEQAKETCLREDQLKRDTEDRMSSLVLCDVTPLPQLAMAASMRAMHSFWIDNRTEEFAFAYRVAAEQLERKRKENDTLDCKEELKWKVGAMTNPEIAAQLKATSRFATINERSPHPADSHPTDSSRYQSTDAHKTATTTSDDASGGSARLRERSFSASQAKNAAHWLPVEHGGKGSSKAEPATQTIERIGQECSTSLSSCIHRAILRNVRNKLCQGVDPYYALRSLPSSTMEGKKKLVFIKTHKTAGTVVTAAMFKTLAAYDYRVAAPFSRIHWTFPGRVTQEELFPTWNHVDVVSKADPAAGSHKHNLYRYDAFVNHACFCPESEAQILRFLGFPNVQDTLTSSSSLHASPVFVTVLRNHRTRFFSSVRYYGHGIIEDLKLRHLTLSRSLPPKPFSNEEHGALKRWWELTTILIDDYELIMHVTTLSARYHTFEWYNGQSYELGLWECRPQNWEPQQEEVKEWLERLDSRFELVMFTEHMAESMVMLAQLFDWPVEQMVMPPMKLTRVTDNGHEELEVYPGWEGLGKKRQERMDQMLHFDQELYRHFHEPFLMKVAQRQEQSAEFDRLVHVYKAGYEHEKELCIQDDLERQGTGRALVCNTKSLPDMTSGAIVSSLELMMMQDHPALVEELCNTLLLNTSMVSELTCSKLPKFHESSPTSHTIHDTFGSGSSGSWLWVLPLLIVILLGCVIVICALEVSRSDTASAFGQLQEEGSSSVREDVNRRNSRRRIVLSRAH